MTAQILRFVLPKRGPRLAANLTAIACAWALLPITVWAAAVGGYREVQRDVLRVVE